MEHIIHVDADFLSLAFLKKLHTVLYTRWQYLLKVLSSKVKDRKPRPKFKSFISLNKPISVVLFCVFL